MRIPHLHLIRRFFGWLIKRKKHAIVAVVIAVAQLFDFAISSMSGPHQLQYLGINILCGVGLVLVAAF